jgi:hypothetical protein
LGQSGAEVNAAETIAVAIRDRKRLSFVYSGHPRIVEPHTFGIDKRGDELLCGYQAGGSSTSGKPVGWKFFHIANISNLRVASEYFAAPRPEYQRNDGAFATILAQL